MKMSALASMYSSTCLTASQTLLLSQLLTVPPLCLSSVCVPFRLLGYCWTFSCLTSVVHRTLYCLSAYSLLLPFADCSSPSLVYISSVSVFDAGYSTPTPWTISRTPRTSIVISMLLIPNLHHQPGFLSWAPGCICNGLIAIQLLNIQY